MVKKRGQRDIVVRGAREHNLKGVDLRLPRGSLTTFTGVSGSGKSSLAFDTIFREGQRRFVESLSSYARQFLGQGEKPRVDHVEGLSPTVSIDQKTVNRNPRSTVGTVTEIQDHLRLLFARLGQPHCPDCGRVISAQTPEEMVDRVLRDHDGRQVMILAPIVHDRKGEYRKEIEELRSKGYVRARIDGAVRRLDEPIELKRYERHTIEVILDRITATEDKRGRIAEAVEQALRLGEGQVGILDGDQHESFSGLLACVDCGVDMVEMEPRTFSFNSPHGACPTCDGLGEVRDVDPRLVVPDVTRTVEEGAVIPSSKGSFSLRRALDQDLIKQVCVALKVRIDRPWRDLTPREQSLVLDGAGDLEIELELHHEGKRLSYHRHLKKSWKGVLPTLRSLYAKNPSASLEHFFSPQPCPSCRGTRLRREALAVTFRDVSIGDLSARTVDELVSFFEALELDASQRAVGERLLRELLIRLKFLARVGLGYLGVDRSAATLSGGESQRIRLATQVGSQLRGILYVLDEPSIGLHQRDNELLIETLRELRDVGNTVLVVEHDKETIESSDHVVDVGPGAGILGGEIVAEGTPYQVRRNKKSVTGAFLSGREAIAMPATRRPPPQQSLTVKGAREHNLKNIDVTFPLGVLTCVTGVSGSGKSTLIDDILKKALAQLFHGAEATPGEHDAIEGLEGLDKVIEIDQSPIGRTPRSNPATYTKVFDLIRDLFAQLPESKARGYPKGRFSFNVSGGRCEACLGAGVRLVEMQFLSDVTVPCEVCDGRRFNPETREIRWRERSIDEILEMTVDEAVEFFARHPKIHRTLETLSQVGLGYMRLGQPSTTLSGGEAQRVKLASQLRRPATGRTLYLLDEPTTGLHFLDIRRLLEALQTLVDRGNTVVVIEHNLDVIKCADWIIDLGPEGGFCGGDVIYQGPFEGVLKAPNSHTGRVLRDLLSPKKKRAARPRTQVVDRSVEGDVYIRGARLHNLQSVDARFPAGQITVVTGPSGSGKTSLAFETLFAEGQRRFVECLSTYARQFLGRMERPPLDAIEGLAPAIAIDQKTASRNPRSTLATTTEIQDYLRLLYARLGVPHCPTCGELAEAFPPDRAVTTLLETHADSKGRLLAPLFVQELEGRTRFQRAGDLRKQAEALRDEGYVRVLIGDQEARLDEKLPKIGRAAEVWLVIDRVHVKAAARGRLLDSVAQAFAAGGGVFVYQPLEGPRVWFSQGPGCPRHGFFLDEELTPRMFSFNSPQGACEVCAGLGMSLRCDPDKLIVRGDKPLFEGAMIDRPGDFFARGERYFSQAVERLCKDMGTKVTRPWNELPADVQRAILHGSDRELQLKFQARRKNDERRWEMRVTWKGLCNFVEDWYGTSTSAWWIAILQAVMQEDQCRACGGERLKSMPRSVTVQGVTLGEIGRMTVRKAAAFVESLRFEGAQAQIAEQVIVELKNRLGFLDAVGLEYLTLDRGAATLSGGESQRIRLATQIGNRLTGVIYVLDEPTIGLHQRDTQRLLTTLRELRDLGNTVVMVEHDTETIDSADWILDLGPGAGHRGGRIVYQGDRAGLNDASTLTADYLAGRRRVSCPEVRREAGAHGYLRMRGATLNNLKRIDVDFPLTCFVAVTGVSGSGKSSLVMDTLARALGSAGGRAPGLESLELDGKMPELIIVDQAPIGTSPSSNPASYVNIFDDIRAIMATAPLAKMRGYGPGRFSFNVVEGRCAMCEGRGSMKVEMHFLPDVWVTCDSCQGRRYNRETLGVEYRGKTIADILEMEISDARQFFDNHKKVARTLQILEDVGLGYMKLGQSATTLSGGEAQRIKLVRELSKRAKDTAVYLLDEPTSGLHLDDVARLVQVLHRLVDRGHTVIVVEHNMEVIRSADYVIDLGPEGGTGGGQVVAFGTPEAVAKSSASITGRFLDEALKRSRNGAAQSTVRREIVESAT